MRKLTLAFLFLVVAVPAPAFGQPAADFTSDPDKILRWGNGYRYPQSGWIVVHIEGEPYERGLQHGRLLAGDIAAHLRSFAQVLNYKAPSETWKTVRTFTNAVFLRKFDKEYLEEMKGIADGAAAAGARFDNRPVDLVDVVALNCWAEIESLGEAAAATPTGLETELFHDPQPQAKPVPRGQHCSAFAATGPATADGKIVFGHITMFGLYPANFYNIWLDVKPAKGHRFVMCCYPGAIQSGMDYYINDAGLLINETTISQTKFDINGLTCASRIRKAIQYADTIDKACEILAKDNNGLYTNEWLLADINTNEIAMFELGTHTTRLWRSSQDQWFGDTPGFYWGCNNLKDMEVRLETIPSVQGKPANVIFRPQQRDITWQKLYHKNKGKIGVEFAKEAFKSPIIAAPTSLDAKFTTTAMAKKLESWAMYGPPTGKTWNPKDSEKQKYPEIKALVAHPWTVLGTAAPPKDIGHEAPVIAAVKAESKGMGKRGGGSNAILPAAWRGTLLPECDGDIWLAAAFADYENMVATERAALKKGETLDAARQGLDKSVANLRKTYTNAKLDVPLKDIKASTTKDDWYKAASSKGVLLLHELRKEVGPALFDKTMDEFGMEFGGTRVSSRQFQDHFERATGRKLDAFFDVWLGQKGLPNVIEESHAL
jgi:Phospholipase B